MKPAGGVRRERPGEIRHNMPLYVGGEGRLYTFVYGVRRERDRHRQTLNEPLTISADSLSGAPRDHARHRSVTAC